MEDYKTGRIDLSKSIEYHEKRTYFNRRYEKGLCYKNALSVLSKIALREKGVKAAGVIGYVLSENETKKVAVRHAWVKIYDRHSTEPLIVDVTMIADKTSIPTMLNCKYVEVEDFTYDEWFGLAVKNNGIPCIENLEGEKEITEMLKKDGYIMLDEVKQHEEER